MKEGRTLKAVIPGGLSAPILAADEIELSLDSESLAAAGSMLGSAAVLVLDDRTSMVGVLKVVTGFYAHESCGQCTPCRVGTAWMDKLAVRLAGGRGRRRDLDVLERVAGGIVGRTLCPMGDAAAGPVLAILKKFRRELEEACEA